MNMDRRGFFKLLAAAGAAMSIHETPTTASTKAELSKGALPNGIFMFQLTLETSGMVVTGPNGEELRFTYSDRTLTQRVFTKKRPKGMPDFSDTNYEVPEHLRDNPEFKNCLFVPKEYRWSQEHSAEHGRYYDEVTVWVVAPKLDV